MHIRLKQNQKNVEKNLEFKGVNYRDLLQSLDSFGGYQDTGRRVILRHDTDSDSMLEKSLQMARIEADMGIRAYYYVLHGRDYWGNWPLIKELQDMGHSVGFHNQVVTVAIKKYGADRVLSGEIDLGGMVADLLDEMRNGGIEVIDTSGHGHPDCYKHHYRNHCIWIGMKSVADIPQYRLSDFGLRYDAMMAGFKGEKYISDSGNRWCISPGMLTKGEPEIASKVIKQVAKNYVLQLNIHPQWWN